MMEIGYMPHEVLMTIFEQVAAAPWTPANETQMLRLVEFPIYFPWTDTGTIIAVSHVCRRWREAVLMTTACWSTILIDFDGDKTTLLTRSRKLCTYIERARRRPLTIIVRNEDLGLYVDEFPLTFYAIASHCIRNASRLYVRFIRSDLGLLIAETLSNNTPLLKELAFWRLRGYEFTATGGRFELAGMEHIDLLASLHHVPMLQTIYTRGLPCPNWSKEFGAMDKLVIEEGSSSVTFDDYGPFLQTFRTVRFLVLLFDGSCSNRVDGPIILLENLDHLEMDLCAVRTFFTPSSRIDAPRLRAFCIHLQFMENETYEDLAAAVAAAWRSSVSPSKRLVMQGFALEVPPASHIRLLQAVSQFDYVDILEFRSGSFRFPKAWSDVWRDGGGSGDMDWEDLFNKEIDSLHAEGNGSSAHLDGAGNDERTDWASAATLNVVQGEGRRIESQEECVPQAIAEDPSLDPPSPPDTDSRTTDFRKCFMYKIHTIFFKDCTFTDVQGATGFANALIARQTRFVTKTDAARLPQRVQLAGVGGDGADAFVSALWGGAEMGLEVRLNEI